MENLTVSRDEKKSEKMPKNRKSKPVIIGAVSIILVLCIGIVVLGNAIFTRIQYNKAINFMDEGNYGKAILMFNNIKDYKDSKDLSRLCYKKCEKLIATNDFNTIGVKSNGKAIFAGNDFGILLGDTFDLSNWTDVIAVSSCVLNTVGLRKYGKTIGDEHASDWEDLVDIEYGYGLGDLYGLKKDGSVVCYSGAKLFDRETGSMYSYKGQSEISTWKNIDSISAGMYHTVGLKTDGTVIAIGENEDGQCEVGEWKDIIAISAAVDHTVGLKADGTVVAVGNNADGKCEVSDWRDVVAISTAENCTFGIKSDGKVVVKGKGTDGQCDVEDWDNIIAISASSQHTIGLKFDGSVVATGNNEYGQCNVEDWNLFE